MNKESLMAQVRRGIKMPRPLLYDALIKDNPKWNPEYIREMACRYISQIKRQELKRRSNT